MEVKKLFRLILAFFAMMSTLVVPMSCSDDDDVLDKIETYNISGKMFVNYEDGYNSLNYCLFNSDGTFITGYGEYWQNKWNYSDHKGVYSVNNNEVVLKINYEDGIDYLLLGKISKVGDKLVLWEGYSGGIFESNMTLDDIYAIVNQGKE